MTALIIGPNGSGKSAYAEDLAVRLAECVSTGSLYYIATLLPFGEEGAARIMKHRDQRAGMGFITVESPYAAAETARRDTVLLEDVSNLVANLMFEKQEKSAASAVMERISRLQSACGNLIAVSIGGLSASDGSNAETRDYIAALQAVNDALQSRADVVVELEAGTPVIRKGTLPCLY